MTTEVKYTANKVSKEASSISSNTGFVKEVVTYMLMDNLVVQPMSTISSITVLNLFNVKEVGVLKEMVVELGMPEVYYYMTINANTSKVFFKFEK